ncbi:flavin reductase [Brevundimonas sp. AAP58]|uniref:flavin reductase family protein n=1 Tax=Brevundimonas sp. AAP58 TaxID=1523422 RepID=UPI0006B8EC1F|nr:flavin reductase family protein [Brevundimonas sp. AAP58]KPF79766.1 flavin reductase [Brevundimonas sp. AAP58]
MSLEPVPDTAARPDEARAYRDALGAFATGVCVVTADGPDGPVGITINSFTSVSLSPRLVLWCLDERSERHPAFAGADRFAIHVLGAEGEGTARRFAKGNGRMADDEFTRVAGQAPVLSGASARFECRTHDRVHMGDHLILVGEVEAYEVTGGETLTYHRGRYGRAGSAAA